MYKYILISIVLFATAITLNQTIDYAPHSDHGSYISLPSRTHAMAQYCRTADVPCSFLPFQYTWANWLWLQAIQYIGTDIYAQYHPELYPRLYDITTLAPYREYPYIFGQLILPDTDDDDTILAQQALDLGIQGLSSLCDMQAIDDIAGLSEEEYLALYYAYDTVAPCDSYLLSKSLGFVSFYYLQDIQSAIAYYRVAALAYDAPDNLVDMPALIVARYDDDRKSMMLWQQRFWAAEDQLNPLLDDGDLFLLLSVMENAVRKAVHHAFVSLIQETAQKHSCDQSIDCVWQHIDPVAQNYLTYCDDENQVSATICRLLVYARDQGRRNGRNRFIYPRDPQAMVYGRRPDLDKWDIVPR